MFSFTVNGKQVSTGETKKLIDFLRDDLRLTSVKNGCMEGACGACMVVVDGKAQRACIPTTAKMEGKSVVTVEGLSQRERQVYAYAFTEAGAVQCGFCIPGMVMSAKALLDSNPAPDRAAVKAALRGNICRCTGYKKIIDAILLAADLLRSGAPVPERACAGLVGDPLGRLDAPAKVLGTAEYADDMALPGMLFGGAVRSAYPRARVLSIDCSAALALEGVVAAVTAEDIPGAQYIGHLVQDWPVLVAQGEITRTVGDAIVLLAAESKAILAQAKQLVQIEYEVLPPVTCPAEALAEGAPLLHKNGNLLKEEHLVRGDAAAAIAASPYVVTAHYSTPFTEHAFLEPETSVSAPDGAGGVIIWSGDQGVYQTQKECSAMLGLPAERVRVIGKAIGGGFGGKEDMSVQHHASLLAYLTGRPVKVSLSRQESIAVHPKRHAMEMDFTTACDENGILTAMTAVIIADTGAYASLGGPVLQRACTHAAGPYHYENIDILGRAVYTNNPPAGAFRGFGVTQSCFAMERNLDLLAKKVGISPFEIRLRNAIRPGQVLPNGQIADDSTALAETLEAVRDVYHSAKYAGIACAMKNSGLGVGIPDTGRCRLVVREGLVHTRTSASCIGQGLATVITQIICRTAGLSPAQVVHEPPDTSLTPDCGNTTASRQTLFCGEATRRAALLLREALEGQSLVELEGREFYGEYLGKTDPMGSPKENPVSHVAYSYATHVVTLAEDGKIHRVYAAHDVGNPINPKNVEGQIEGGVVMSLGYALTEDYPLKDCVPQAKFGTLGLFRAPDTPEVVPIIVGKGETSLAYGAKGIGEISSIPTAPAVAAAYEAFDGKVRASLPLADTPYSRKKK